VQRASAALPSSPLYLLAAPVVLLALVPAAGLGLVLPGTAVVATVAGPVDRQAHLPVPAVELRHRVTARQYLAS